MRRIFFCSCGHFILLLGLLTASGFVHAASVSLVTDPADLGSNDSIRWGQLGMEIVGSLTPLSAPADIASIGGINASISSPSPFYRWDQDNGWSGHFDQGNELVVSIFGLTKELTIDFATPIFGAGAQIQSEDTTNISGSFIGQIEAFDGNNQSLGIFQSDSASNISTIFIGVLSNTMEINKITFSLFDSNKGFAINALDIRATATPLPGTFWLLISGIGILGLQQRRASLYPE